MRASFPNANLWVVAALLIAAGWGCRGILGAEYGELVEATHDGGVGGAGGAAGDSAVDGDAPEPKKLACTIEGPTQTLLDLGKFLAGDPPTWITAITSVSTKKKDVLVGLRREGVGAVSYDLARIDPYGVVQWAHMLGAQGSFVGLARLDGSSSGVFILDAADANTIQMAELPDDMGSIGNLQQAVPFTPTISLNGMDAKYIRSFRAGPAMGSNFTAAFSVQNSGGTYAAYAAMKRGVPQATPLLLLAAGPEDVDVRTVLFPNSQGLTMLGSDKAPLTAVSYSSADPPVVQSSAKVTSQPGPALLDARPAGDGNVTVAFGDPVKKPPTLYVGALTEEQFLLADPRTLLKAVSPETPSGFEWGEMRWCGKSLLGAGRIRPVNKVLSFAWVELDGQVRYLDALSGADVSGEILVAEVGCDTPMGPEGGTISILWIEKKEEKQVPYHLFKRVQVNCQ